MTYIFTTIKQKSENNLIYEHKNVAAKSLQQFFFFAFFFVPFFINFEQIQHIFITN